MTSPEPTFAPRPTRGRRWAGRLISAALMLVAIALAGRWVFSRFDRPAPGFEVKAPAEAAALTLGPGDVRIYNVDSSVTIALIGDRILAGLSPQTIEKVRAQLSKESSTDSGGFGGFVAGVVKKTVAEAIATQVAFPLSGIRDIKYEDGRLIVISLNGEESGLLKNTRIDGEQLSESFGEQDAERFVEAVRARKAELASR